MEKVIIIGCPGSGKTTFAEKLNKCTGLPLYYLDAIWHKPDKTHISREEFDERIIEIFNEDKWIIDGNYKRTIEMRLKECDTVFLFDLPTEICIQGATERIGKARYELPWLETELDPEFKAFIEEFPSDTLPYIYELLDKYKADKNIIIFKLRSDADEYISKVIKMQQINYGMPTLIETSTLEECGNLCVELGLNFIELNMNLPQYQLNNFNVDYFKSVANKYGIYYTIHLDENLNISDFNSYIADAYKKTVAKTIEIAKKLNIKILNMHMAKGVYFTLPDKKVHLFSECKEQYLNSIIDFKNMCDTAIGDADIKICIENCDGYENFQKEAIELLLDSKNFGLTFDVGHNHGIGGTDEEFIMKNKDRLNHIHLHDAMGRKNHLTLGTGEMNIEKYLNLAVEQNCSVVLETKTIEGLKQSVEWLKGIYNE